MSQRIVGELTTDGNHAKTVLSISFFRCEISSLLLLSMTRFLAVGGGSSAQFVE